MMRKEKAESRARTGTVQRVKVLRTRAVALAHKGTATTYIAPQVTGER